MVPVRLTLLASWLSVAFASVTVHKTNQGPTGYEVTFRYQNETAANVLLGGRLKPFTDQFHTSLSYSEEYDPHDYRPGDFWVDNIITIDGFFNYNNQGPGANFSGFVMIDQGNGTWEYTAPFPSGTFAYAFLPDCGFGPSCTFGGPNYVRDIDNAPLENVAGQVDSSLFQVPFDARFQHYDAFDLNFDYSLPTSAANQGSWHAVNYSSPGSTIPANGVHDFAMYTPVGYPNTTEENYHLLYLSHGGGGDAWDWPNFAKVGQTLDRLIAEGYIPPTVVVCPSFENLTEDGATLPAYIVRENYQEYLFPFVEETYPVGGSPDKRAFAGLSLGGVLTYEMYINATSYFGWYGIFSGALGPGANQTQYVKATDVQENPALLDRGIFLGFGAFDIALEDCYSLQLAFDLAHISYVNRFVPWGSHAWNTWSDTFWNFGRIALWKEKPFNGQTGRVPERTIDRN